MNVNLRRRTNPIVEIGNWSIRHPWRAIGCWVAFVAVAATALAVTGSKDLQNGAVGESARGYGMLAKYRISPAQFDYGYLHSSSMKVSDPAFRAATADVEARMHAVLGARITVRTSRMGTPLS